MRRFALSVCTSVALGWGVLVVWVVPGLWGASEVCLAQEASPGPPEKILATVSAPQLLLAASRSRVDLTDRLASEAEKAIAEHPLEPLLKTTREGLDQLGATIQDYSCVLVKRERLNGRLQPTQYIFTKVRHKPFSVYLKFLGPKKLKGRECLYVEGQYGGKLIAHEGQGFLSKLPAVKINPLGQLAMDSQRYPITEIGFRRLAERIYETLENDRQYDECHVKIIPDVKIKDREAYCVEMTHPEPRKHFSFHVGRVFVDKKLGFPIRYEGYLWPKNLGGNPVLDEEYTYLRVKINNHFTDEDFDPKNKKYDF